MYQSLSVTLSSLPKPTLVYCGHEVNNTQVPINEMKNIIGNVLMTGHIILNDECDWYEYNFQEDGTDRHPSPANKLSAEVGVIMRSWILFPYLCWSLSITVPRISSKNCVVILLQQSWSRKSKSCHSLIA